MKIKLKVGVIGLGHQAIEDHIPAIKNSKDVELIGVVDSNKEVLDNFSIENPGINVFNNLEKMIKKNKPDFVIISLPHNCHYENTKLALENKIHVLKEKPFMVSLKQAKKINEIAKKNNLKVGITLQRRFNPIYSTFFQLLDKIGNPHFIDAKYTFFTDRPYEGWRGDKNLAGGGCLIDMGYHIVDLLIWYFGLPEKVFSEFSSNAKEDILYSAEDTASVIFNYEKKKIWGNLTISRVIPPKQEFLNVYGTRGIIHLERGKIERYLINGDLKESLERKDSWPSAAQDQLECFVKVIKGEKENINKSEDHYKHLAFIEAAYQSKKDGTYVNPYNLLNKYAEK